MPVRPFSRRTLSIRPSSISLSGSLTAGLLLLAGLAQQAQAADTFFLGTWNISKAVVAPWADPAQKPNDKEMKSLVGKTLTFKAGSIAGPGITACKGPAYEVSVGGADMIFQGALTQKQDGSAQDPAKPAADLGFQGSNIKTLQTGCENELDYSFIDDKTAEFGLNDYVYTITRQ